jgi:peptidyl-prolyl cis-trans isomerase C
LKEVNKLMLKKIGWQVPAMLVGSVRDVVRSLAKGQTSEQVQSPFGWHVLRVEDIRQYEFPAFEKAKPVLQQQLQQQAALRAIEAIKNKALVK